MKIGFSIGDFYRIQSVAEERFLEKYINLFKVSGASAIELHSSSQSMVSYLLGIDIDLSQFSFISFHAPLIPYRDDELSNKLMADFELLWKKYKINNFVFHADTIHDWKFLTKYKNLPISIENMDNNKKFGRTVEDMESILDKYNLNLTLDLQHCFVNDNSMKLSLDFQKKFNDKIVEYHISGFGKKYIHYPLFKTKQDEIIYSLQNKDIPIIIESTFDVIGEQKKEIEYIKSRIN